MYKLILILLSFLNLQTSVHAYIGPVLGGGLIFTILGFVLVLFLFLVGIIWFPIKKFLSKYKKKNINNSKK